MNYKVLIAETATDLLDGDNFNVVSLIVTDHEIDMFLALAKSGVCAVMIAPQILI